MSASPKTALLGLSAAADSGRLAQVCRHYGVSLMVAFGSALDEHAEPRDLDLAVRFESDPADVLGLLDALAGLGAGDEVDLMVLNHAGPVARERALVGGQVLFQARPGEFANTQIAAIMERLDTEWLRSLQLDVLVA